MLYLSVKFAEIHFICLRVSRNKLEGDVVSLQAQTAPYFHLREKYKCMENIDKSETWLKTSP